MINERIKELYESNRHLFEGKPIAFDGIVNEEIYLSSKTKVTFLLKEINDPNMKSDWTDYMDWLNKGAPDQKTGNLYKTWPNVCLWIELLKNPTCSYKDCLNSNLSFDESSLKNNLKNIAIVNLKKTGGGGSSNWEELREATLKCKDFIVSELKEIPSDIVICGGTFDFAKMLFPLESKNQHILPSGATYFLVDNTVYLDFVHPMWYSVNRNILFAYAKEVFNDLFNLELI